jgi:uncharacterized protein (DUF608 family)
MTVTHAAPLFPMDLPSLTWTEFPALGFERPVSGVIYTAEKSPCCGVALGGISTGCLDIDVRGVYGFCSIFHATSPRFEHSFTPRKLPTCEPILGLSIGERTWVLAAPQFVEGGNIEWCTSPAAAWGKEPKIDIVTVAKIEGVEAATDIHYWGHYPVADMQFETDAPVSVAMRAWAPLLPGDTPASNIPAAVFEVQLCNTSQTQQDGTVAFNFPGPDHQEARSTDFSRDFVDEDFEGMMISSAGGVNYVLGVLDCEDARFGAGLNSRPNAWPKISSELPEPDMQDVSGKSAYHDSSCSAAVDFSLPPGEMKHLKFLLTWYAPVWEGGHEKHVRWTERQGHDLQVVSMTRRAWLGDADTNYYTEMYAARYTSALDVAREMVEEHESLLNRVLSWQSVIYDESSLPVWLRDSLVNNLYMIAECSHWAQAKPPLGDFCYHDGAFGLLESPRACPQMACMPCDWYGNLPIVFFFPELAISTLTLIRQYQMEDGEVPFSLGKFADLPDFATPSYSHQVSLNGFCYVDMLDRVWCRTEDDSVLREFYESAKRCNTYTMNLCTGPAPVISMPDGGGMEWFEMGEWVGMAAHMGGLRLAGLRIMERMAETMGDSEYAEQCRSWYADGARAMEEEMWTGSYYLNFFEKETGKKSDEVMAYQLDGQWTSDFHGVGEAFPAKRVKMTLETIKRCNIALTPHVGAANFVRPDGSPLPSDSKVAEYGLYGMFSAELLLLAMVYIYSGEKDFGLELARKHWEMLVIKHRHPWDMPNLVDGDTGERNIGTDYYQTMMLWALPAALEGQDLTRYCAAGGLLDRIICAAEK